MVVLAHGRHDRVLSRRGVRVLREQFPLSAGFCALGLADGNRGTGHRAVDPALQKEIRKADTLEGIGLGVLNDRFKQQNEQHPQGYA